jgi:PhzF family phenazine biosynthesis protein
VTVRIAVVDAFTDAAFRGNPAGVVLLDAPADASWMQHVATEMRHSETAFVLPRPDGDHDLRWFTPAVEVDLCGHATLATAHVLLSGGLPGPFAFHTRSGVLRASGSPDGRVVLDFPARPPYATEDVDGLAAALGAEPLGVWRAGDDVLVEVADAATVRGVEPDVDALGAVDARGVVVTAAAEPGADHDFVSRFFAPTVGVDEDPVTGSAHCALAPFWCGRLGRTSLMGVQLSARTGRVGVELRDDRVMLTGSAVTVLEGAFTG